MKKFEAEVHDSTVLAIDRLRETMKTRDGYKDEENFLGTIVEHGVQILEDRASGAGSGSARLNPIGLGTR
jgi:hypothetical protein